MNRFAFSFILLTLSFHSACNSQFPADPPLDEQIGAMLMVGFRGFEVADNSHIVRDIRDYHLGGVILFDYDVPASSSDRNIQSADQVRRLNRQLQELAGGSLMIAVDQEGGRVARLKEVRGFPKTLSAQALGSTGSTEQTMKQAVEQGALLHDLGFTINFAPVVDVNTNPENPVIGRLERSYSTSPQLVTEHAKATLDAFHRHGVTGVIKHFPGHGSAWNDSHVGMADVTDTWEPIELKPYKDLIASGSVKAIMTAHVFNENLDPDFPATLSPKVIQEMLRDSMGFDGLVFSDDMQMDAVREFYGLETTIRQAILARVDVLVFANNSVYDPNIVPKAVAIIKKLVEDGVITKERIHESWVRIQKQIEEQGNFSGM